MTTKERYHSDPEYRAKNRAANREWFRKNKARRTAYNQKRNIDTREYKAKAIKKWLSENRERHLENCRRWYRENREARKLTKKRWRLANPDKTSASVHRWRERIRRGSAVDNRKTFNIFRQIIDACPWLFCGLCGRNIERKDRTIDHIIPLYRGGTNDPTNLQIVHRVCNSRKNTKLPQEMNFAGNRAHLKNPSSASGNVLLDTVPIINLNN